MMKMSRVLWSSSLILALGATASACKPRNPGASAKAEGGGNEGGGTGSGLKDFPLETSGTFARKLGARLAAADVPAAGCAHAARYVITGSPGRQKLSWKQNRGELRESLKAAANSGQLGWDRLEEWVTLPTFAFMACKGLSDYPGLNEAPKENLGTFRLRAAAMKEKGLRMVVVLASAEDATVAPGFMTSVKAALAAMPELVVKEVKLKGLGGLEQATQDAQTQLADGVTDTDALIIWAYGVAGPIVVNAMAGDADPAVKLRNRTGLLMTVASPMGGALPALVADKEVKSTVDRLISRFSVLGFKSMDDATYRAAMRPADWLRPEARAGYLQALKGQNFGLSRSPAQKAALGERLEIAHVAAVQDPANLRVLPRFTAEGGTKYGIADLSGQLLLPIYQSFPLSDGVVALEHAVIPPGLAPAGVDVRLTGVLRLGHFDMAFGTRDTNEAPGRQVQKLAELPSLAIADALFASAFHAIDTNEVAEKEPPYDPLADKRQKEEAYAAANGMLIKSKWNNMCLDVPDQNGNILYAHPCHGGANQRWFFDKISGAFSFRTAVNGQLCADAHTGEKEKQAGYVYMVPCHLRHNQNFFFGRLPNSVEPLTGMAFAEIHNPLYGNARCLDIDPTYGSAPNGNKTAHKVYFNQDCHGGENQQWAVAPDLDAPVVAEKPKAAAPPAPALPPRTDTTAQYRRVLVIGEDAGVTNEQKLAIADGFASAVERAVNLNMGRVMYGRRAGQEAPVTTPLAFLIHTIEDINTAMNETFMSNQTYEKYLVDQLSKRAGSDPWILGFDMRKVPLFSRLANPFEQSLGGLSGGQSHQLNYEILTLPATTELPEPDPASIAGKLRDSGMSLAALMLQAARVGDAKEYDKILALYDQADAFTAIDAQTAQAKGLYKLARDAYVDATKDDGKAWMPMYLSVALDYGPQGIQPSIRAILRPGPGMAGPVGDHGAKFDALPPSEKVVQKNTLDYSPHLSFSSAAPAAMAISASTMFGGVEAKRPVAKLTWGRMSVANDVRAVTQCSTDCTQDVGMGSIGRHYPTINGVFRFEFIEAIGESNADRSWFGRLKEGVKRRVNQAVQGGASFAAGTAEKANFHLLIQTLAIELGTDVLRVVPTESRFTLAVGDGKSAMVVNNGNNEITGMDAGMVGFDMYAMVAPDIAKGFSKEINATFKKGLLANEKDFDEKQAGFMKALEPVVRALNTY